jgi:mannosidase alpha-like ER degradation enhancer 1
LDSQALTVPLHALYDYVIQAQDVFQLVVDHPSVTTHVRSYLDSDYEISLRITNTEQCQELIGLQSDIGPTYPLHIPQAQVYLFSDTKRLHACDPYSYQDAKVIRNKVLLVSRGHCNFYDKILHAQQAGARAVILMNNKQERVSKFRVVGSGPISIQIPSLLLSYQDSQSLLHSKPIQSLAIQQLPSIDDDPQASIQLMFLGERVRNLVILNV